MCEEELVVLYEKDNYAYCKYETFALGSDEAKKAHYNIRKIKQEGCQIINVESITEEEMELFLEKIDSEIRFYEAMNTLDVNMVIKSSDLFSVFNLDGDCFIENLESCAMPEIRKLLRNPDESNGLNKIKQVTYRTAGIQEIIPTGYMIPMIAVGDFFSLEEAENIFGLNSINTSRDGIHCQFALNPVSTSNLLLMKSAKNAKKSDASEEDKEKFEKEKKLMFNEYKANYELIQSYKNTKDQVLEIYFKNSKKM